MVSTESKMIPRILRDVSDGVLVLDRSGTILFLNPKGEEMLGFGADAVGQKYAAAILRSHKGGNDSFHKFLLESLQDSTNTHKGEIVYNCPDGRTINLSMTTSCLFDEDGTAYEGLVVQFSDISEIVRLRKQQAESSFVFVTVIIYVCLWVFVSVIWELMGKPVSDEFMTQIVQIIGFGVFLLVLKNTSFSLKDLGLGFKGVGRYLITDSIIAAVGLALMIGVKLIVNLVAPDVFPGPFFNFDFGWADWGYPVIVVMQEFLTRSVMHENMRRVIVGKNSETVAIVVSSIMFGVLHLHKDILFMIGSVILLGALGMLYRKQRTIWGLCIPHYVLGMALTVLF